MSRGAAAQVTVTVIQSWSRATSRAPRRRDRSRTVLGPGLDLDGRQGPDDRPGPAVSVLLCAGFESAADGPHSESERRDESTTGVRNVGMGLRRRLGCAECEVVPLPFPSGSDLPVILPPPRHVTCALPVLGADLGTRRRRAAGRRGRSCRLPRLSHADQTFLYPLPPARRLFPPLSRSLPSQSLSASYFP